MRVLAPVLAPVLALTLAALLPAAAEAQTVDCANAQTQAALNVCAAQDLAAADAELNAAYAEALAVARSGSPGLEERLRAAQRAWIGFRDAACDVEAAIYEGGSMAPMVLSSCLARLTADRAEDLWSFAYGTP